MHTQCIQTQRFLANEFGLAGRNNTEKAQADEVVDAVVDLQNAAVNNSDINNKTLFIFSVHCVL